MGLRLQRPLATRSRDQLTSSYRKLHVFPAQPRSTCSSCWRPATLATPRPVLNLGTRSIDSSPGRDIQKPSRRTFSPKPARPRLLLSATICFKAALHPVGKKNPKRGGCRRRITRPASGGRQRWRPTFILGGRFAGQSHGLYQIYPHQAATGSVAPGNTILQWWSHTANASLDGRGPITQLSLEVRRPALPGVAGDAPPLAFQSDVRPPFEVALLCAATAWRSPISLKPGARPIPRSARSHGLDRESSAASSSLPRFAWEAERLAGLRHRLSVPPSPPTHLWQSVSSGIQMSQGHTADTDVVQGCARAHRRFGPTSTKGWFAVTSLTLAAAAARSFSICVGRSMTACPRQTARAALTPVSSQPVHRIAERRTVSLLVAAAERFDTTSVPGASVGQSVSQA